MSDRPIIFSAPMIRALLAGRKTQTRRILKPRGLYETHPSGELVPIPRFAVGMQLWVRETWAARGTGVWTIADARSRMAWDQRIFYAADGGEGPWWPSIHMPREFSRLTLAVTDVRIERLQSICEKDAIAEGIGPAVGGMWSGADGQAGTTPRAAYAVLWDAINGPRSWAATPWICAITFSVEHANIDANRPPEPVSAGKAAL